MIILPSICKVVYSLQRLFISISLLSPLTIMGKREGRGCPSHLIDEKPRWQKLNVTRENKLAMNLRGELRDGGGSKSSNIFCGAC